MPELPEVETIRRQLMPHLLGEEIVDAESHSSAKFTAALDAIGAEIANVGRRGKYLVIKLSDGHELIVHLGMTGRLAVSEINPKDLNHRHLRAWWKLNNGSRLTFHDIRRFGRIYCVPSGDYASIPTLSKMGPEPWDHNFNATSLATAVRHSSRHLKTLLLSQRVVAGIGNIYADEALWLAGINPATRNLSQQRASTLVGCIRKTLDVGISNGGTTLRDYTDANGQKGTNQLSLNCYGRAGQPCHKCGTTLSRRMLDARSTTWCKNCQGH